MNKRIVIPVITVLMIGIIVAGYFLWQQTDKLREAESEIVALEGNVTALQTNLAELEARISTLEAKFVPVTFPDPNLEAAIRRALGIGPDIDIYRSDLEELTGFDASRKRISNLSGLEHAVNLIRLGLEGNQISDLSPLANLTNLTRLHLEGNQINDISPLANLTNLASLWLGGNQISDISPLANLTNLTGLWLEGNQISDIGPLVQNEGLSDGDRIDLWRNPLSEASFNTYIPQLVGRGVGVGYDISPIR